MKNTEKTKVLCAVLTSTERQGWLCPELSQMLVKMAQDQRYTMLYATIKDARPVECARNHALALARDQHCEWALQLDNDNFMPTGTPFDIIASAGPQQNVIGLSYGTIPKPNSFAMFPPPAPSTDHFREVEAVAGGVLMVHRSVWQTIPRGPWFRWQHGDSETLDQSTGGYGEDVSFCRLVREHGLKVWTHTQLAGHYRSCDLTGIVCTLAQLNQQAQAQRTPAPQSQQWVTMPR